MLKEGELAKCEGQDRIETLEMLAARTALECWGQDLEESTVFGSVDNATQLFASIKISAKSQQVAGVAASMSVKMARAKITPWWRYENTLWNIADFFTRSDILDIAIKNLQPLMVEIGDMPFRDWIRGK